jgi:hypothetical protein
LRLVGKSAPTSKTKQVEVDLKEYRNQILEDKEWIDLFVVKKSTIRGAGWRLIASRDFVPNETLRICAGKVRRVLKGDPVYQPSEYTMLMSSDNPSDIGTIICYMEQEGIPDRFDSKRLPLCFGFHMCSDISFPNSDNTKNRRTRNCNAYETNIYVSPSLIVRAAKNINLREELLLEYNYSGKK